MLAPNTILQNRYRVVRKLGQGGMGAIYEAIDERVSCLVALKETLVGSSSEVRAAFHREAALLANLRHPALPKVMDYFGEGDGEFLVMEFIPGNDLAELLTLRNGPFPQEQVILWAIELLKLLEYLHTLNPPILHRDIKPANLKTTKNGEVYLLDFGLAKGVAGQMVTMETSRSVPGYTPIYAPLEQILGQGTDARSDLYSLGATLYHLLTGQAPASAPVRFDAIENNRPDPLKLANQLNSRVALEVAACIDHAMSLSRKDRPSSAIEMRTGLEKAARVVEGRDIARKAEEAIRDTQPAVHEGDPARPLVVDKDVQFTVYTPQKIKPEKNYSVLAFAHLSRRRDDAAEYEPDPIEEMKKQAARVLADQLDDYRDTKDSGRQPVPRGGELTFVPVVKGLTFNPPSRSFTWRKSVHREEFDVRASGDLDGQTLNGSMTVFLSSVIIAEVGLTISVDSRATSAAERLSLDHPRSARRVRQVFASYSHKDEQVVAELAHVAPLFGSRFIMDRTHLEPGEDRVLGLQRLIRDSDVFQLFWSTNSMRSSETADEIRYAATLGRSGFILPTYWEEPLPRSPAEGLPPPEIERLQFYRIYPGAISQATFARKEESRLVIVGPSGAEIYIDDERHASIGRSGRVIVKGVPTGKHVLRVTRSGDRDDERVIEIREGSGEQVIQTNLELSQTTSLASGYLSPTNQPPTMAPDSSIDPGLATTRDQQTTGELALPTQTMQAPSVSSAAPDVGLSADIVVCITCGMRYKSGTAFCTSCGTRLTEAQRHDSIPRSELLAAAAPIQNYQAPAPSRRKAMIPIFAGAAAMVLLIMLVAPVLLISTYRTASVNPSAANPGSANTYPADNTNATGNTNATASTNATANVNNTANSNSDFDTNPEVQFARLGGGTLRLHDFHGRVVLLNFWTTKGAPSRSEIPILNDLQETLGQRGLSVIGISYDDTADEVKQFQKEVPLDYQIGLRGKRVDSQLPASSLPTTYIIDRRGRVRKRMVGAQSKAALQAAIEPLLNEEP